MPGFDFYKMDQQWRDEQAAEQRRTEEAKAAQEAAAQAPPAQEQPEEQSAAQVDEQRLSQAEELADTSVGDLSREGTIRQQIRDGQAALEREKDDGLEKLSKVPEYQRRAIAMMGNALTMKNVQKVVTIGNREKVRKGLSKEPVRQKAMGAQVSTIAIPTALLRYVQQEIGAVQSRLNQNDAMAGFLYWYFGQPDDVMFQDDTSASRVSEVVANLDANASPARMGQLNYNISASLMDKLEVISERLDGMAAMMGMIKGDGTELKVRADKSYLAVCYMLLNYLGFAPLTSPGQRPSDLDLLVGGLSWDMMASVDDAYDWFRTTDGREKYKAKHGMRPARPYTPPAASAQPSYSGPAPEYPQGGSPADDDDDQDDTYYGPEDDDDYLGYESVEDMEDMDDLFEGLGADDTPIEDEEGSADPNDNTDMAALLRASNKRKMENERAKSASAKFKKKAQAAGG